MLFVVLEDFLIYVVNSNIFLNCFKMNFHVWCSCSWLSELYCNASPLHVCITTFTGFSANSVSKLKLAEEHKYINYGREMSINKMWKGNRRDEKG